MLLTFLVALVVWFKIAFDGGRRGDLKDSEALPKIPILFQKVLHTVTCYLKSYSPMDPAWEPGFSENTAELRPFF